MGSEAPPLTQHETDFAGGTPNVNASKTVCIDQIPKVIEAAREHLSIREKLQPLLDAGWFDGNTQAHRTIRGQSLRVGVVAKPNQDGSFDVYTIPGDVHGKVESVAEVFEFADKLEQAVEQADLN